MLAKAFLPVGIDLHHIRAGGALLAGLHGATGEAAKPTLRTTRTALRSFRMLGKEVPNREAVISFHKACYDSKSGGFAAEPGGPPDPISTSVGLMILKELELPSESYIERGLQFMNQHTHQDNFTSVARLSSILDHGFATLLTDLRARGLLEDTLIVCQGEFGRTPRINGASGRDHWPASWSAVLAGGGIRGGQAIGSTSADGTEVDDNQDGKVQPTELSTFYRKAGLGQAWIGVGKLPVSATLTKTLLELIDQDKDGKTTEQEWAAAEHLLKSVDRNGDGLIGVEELVPQARTPERPEHICSRRRKQAHRFLL